MSSTLADNSVTVAGDATAGTTAYGKSPLRNFHVGEGHPASSQLRSGGARPPVRSLLHAAGIVVGPEAIPAASSSTQDRAGLPLTQLLDIDTDDDQYYTVTTVDDRGRLADRTPLVRLGWDIGTQITALADPAAGVITVHLGGNTTIARPGRLHLPATIRHACRVHAGTRLLVAAQPADERLVAYLPFAMKAMTGAYHVTPAAQQP